MQRILGLPDAQVAAFEDQIEAVVRAALAQVMDTIARRIEASMPTVASSNVEHKERVLVGSLPFGGNGFGIPIGPQGTLVGAVEDVPPDVPGQPYVSPDDLASIPPLWQEAVAEQVLPIAAQVFLSSVGKVHADMIDASSIAGLPSVGSLAAEQYLAQASNTFDQIGDHLWATARQQLSEGFEAGESIPQLAERLRGSAEVTARTGVLVARTQVIEASNAGSFAVAQASGLQMKKFWIATDDLRTRPEHLDAESNYGPGGTPGPIDLNQPFIVGGYSAMFPAASSLPPSMRFNCRCTPGYLMPDKAPGQVRAQDALDQQIQDLPGTSGIDDIAAQQSARLKAIIDQQHADVEAAIEDVHRRFGETFGREAGPGFDLPARGEHPQSYIRPSLVGAKTPRELRRVWQDEVQAITGHPFLVDRMPTGVSMVTAREYAEGTLQMFAQFPEARIDRIHWFDDAASSSYAQVRRGGHAIEFNMRYASEKGRPKFLEARRRDAAGWDSGDTSWGVRNDRNGQGVVYHEFTHILDIENAREAIHGKIVPLLIQHAQREGITDIDDLIKRRISSYATKNYQEMVAEAGADVMVNGAAASQLSRDIFDLLRQEYRARGFGLRTGPTIAPGEVFPKIVDPLAVRPSLEAAQSVKDLSAIARVEAKAITGRDVGINFQGSDFSTAKEHAEGILRGFERFPDAKVHIWHYNDRGFFGAYAHTRGWVIDFNTAWANTRGREKYLQALRYDVDSGWHPAGTATPISTALHEFGHAVAFGVDHPGLSTRVQAILRGASEREGIPEDVLIKREVSAYATSAEHELVAEAFTDVMMNGASASRLSHEIFDAVVAEYRLRGGIVREAAIGDALPSLPSDVFPKAAAPRSASSLTVAQLRAELKAADVAIPTGARKADLVRLVEERRATPAAVRELPPPPPLSRAPLAYQARQDALRADAARPVLPDKSRRMSGEGSYATRVEHQGGPPTVTKDYSRLGETKAEGKRSADAEELGVLIDDAVGLRAPAVIRTGSRSVEQTFIEGPSGEEILPWPHRVVPDDLLDSDDGRFLGLSDLLVGDNDRHAGNWIRTADGRLVPLDRGSAFQSPRFSGATSPFARRLVDLPDDRPAGSLDFDIHWARKNDFNPADLAVIRTRLEALRPEFERLGRATWHRQVMARLVEVEKRADPNAAIRLAEARPDLAAIKGAQRAAARAQAAVIATQRGNAALIARVEELVQAKASKAVIRQELDPALREAEQLYAGADKAVADALRTAVDSGDAAKIRAALTRQSKASGLTPIGKAGAKAKFDPATMEGVGGTAIPDGADVIVVRRGAKLAGIETPEKATVRLARAPSTAKTVAKGDFTGLTRTSEAMGGNPGGIFEAGDGSRWYVKAAAGDAQARSEALALDLYRAAGLDAPELVIGQGVEGLGQRQIATRFLDDAQIDLRARLASDPAYIAEVQDGFAADAWLANWDVVGANPAPGMGWDNIVSVAGQPVRIEAGGALRFRGLGGDKPFGDDVLEFDSLRDPQTARRAAQVFGDMTPEQLIASAERVRKVTPAKIKALVKKHGLDSDLADTLIARREDILRRAEALVGPKPMMVREYNAAIKAAAKDQKALDAVPAGRRATGESERREVWEGLDDPRIREAVREYQEFGYEDVNFALRAGPDEKSFTAGRRWVPELDRAFDGSRLTDDVTLWRSPGSGQGIFGDSATWGDDLAGFEWSDSAYSSTSASRAIADHFAKDDGVRLRILAPRGSKAIQLSGMPTRSQLVDWTDESAEAEILLGRGARYRVVRDRGWTEIKHPTTHQTIRVRDLDVEVTVPDETPPLPWATTAKKVEALPDRHGALGPIFDRAASGDKVKADVAAVLDGKIGKYTVTVTKVNFGEGDLTDALIVRGVIKTADGKQVGKFLRDYRRDDHGDLVAHHDFIQISRAHQGQGFAQEFNDKLLAWYRSSGVKRVELTANVDIGGYAWASTGYDFANAQAAALIADRLEGAMVGFRLNYFKPAEVARLFRGASQAQIQSMMEDAEALLARLGSTSFGQPGYPTAYEISQIGRWAGAGKDDMWLGKYILLESQWDAVLPLA